MERIVIGNIIALVASILMVYAGYIKVKKKILFTQIIQILLSVVSNLVLGGYTGAIINAVSCVRDILCYKDKLGTKEKVVLIIASTVFSIMFNNLGWIGYLPLISTVVYIIFMSVKDVKKFKYLTIFAMASWLIYDIYIKAYVAAVFDAFTIITSIIAIIQIIRKKEKNKMKILIFSDLHYAPERPINNGSKIERKLIEYAEPILDKLTNKINNEIKPDLVLNLGDLVEDFNDHDKDIENLKYIWGKFQRINPTFYSCIGNHDLRSMTSRKEVEKIMGYPHSTFSFDKDGLHVVILGTYVNNEMGTAEGGIFKTQFISEEDMNWLREDLDKNQLPCIVCVHFGVAEDDMKGNWWFESCPETALLGNRKELKQILKNDNNVLAVFSGHQHWTKTIIEDKMKYFVVGSMTENINNDGIPDGVYFVIDFDGKDIKVSEEHIRLQRRVN